MEDFHKPTGAPVLTSRQQVLTVTGLAASVLAAIGFVLVVGSSNSLSQTPHYLGPDSLRFVPTTEQRASLKIETVTPQLFHTEIVTEGYVAPNGGLVTPGLAASGRVEHGLPVLAGQSADVLQAQSDFVSSRAQLQLAQTNEKRQRELYGSDGAALKDWQQSQLDLATAATSFASVRSRLRMLGKSNAEIAAFEHSPRVFAVGDSSLVWLIANVREADAAQVHIGDQVQVRVPAYPGELFQARLSYVASAIDAVSHRLVVGAQIRNPGGRLKPNMLATITIIAGPGEVAPSVPRGAVIFEGDDTRVWVVQKDGSLALRVVAAGRSYGDRLEMAKGLAVGERVVTAGALFIDRAARNG